MQYRDDNVELARARGWVVVPARVYNSKEGWRQHPLTGWPDVTETPELSAWQPNDGIACVLAPSHIVDIDLDSAVARDLAPRFLRSTATYGRPGRERTHYLYECSAEQSAQPTWRMQQFRDPLGMLLELRRGHGTQTLLPGTRKGWGTDTITVQEWTDDAELETWTDADEVRVHELAVACYLALGDAEGARHATALAAAGVLARAGWSMDAATRVITAACEFRGDSNLADRVRAIEATFDKHARGEPVASWTALRDAGVDPRRLAELGKVLHCGRARIDLAVPMHEVVERSIAALGDVPVSDATVFRHRNALMHANMTPCDAHALRVELSRAIDFIRTTKDGEKVVHPPKDVADAVIASARAGRAESVREILGIWRVPMLRDDGSVSTARGYDPTSKRWIEPVDVGVIGTTKAEAERAATLLLESVEGALWDPDHPGELAWLAHVLTVAARPLCPTVPVFVYSANASGSGKSTLAKCAGQLGAMCPRVFSPKADGSDDAELARALDMYANEGAIVFDNLRGTIRSPVLESAVTEGSMQVRRLHIGPAHVTISCVIAMTSNGLSTNKDWARREIPVRLDRARPGQLDGRRDLVAEMAARPELTGAVLTILRAWLLSGEVSGATALPGFARWSEVVGGALHWLGLGDVVASTRALADEMADTEEDAELVDAITSWLHSKQWADRGATCSEMLGVTTGGFGAMVGAGTLAARLRSTWPGELTPKGLGRRLTGIEPLPDGRRLLMHRTKEGRFWRVVTTSMGC